MNSAGELSTAVRAGVCASLACLQMAIGGGGVVFIRGLQRCVAMAESRDKDDGLSEMITQG